MNVLSQARGQTIHFLPAVQRKAAALETHQAQPLIHASFALAITRRLLGYLRYYSLAYEPEIGGGRGIEDIRAHYLCMYHFAFGPYDSRMRMSSNHPRSRHMRRLRSPAQPLSLHYSSPYVVDKRNLWNTRNRILNSITYLIFLSRCLRGRFYEYNHSASHRSFSFVKDCTQINHRISCYQQMH